MHIQFFHQYYHTPDCAATGRQYHFIKRLAERHTVTVISTDATLRRRLTEVFPLAPPGVELCLFPIPHENQMEVPRRLFAYGGYAARAFWRGTRLPKPDVVIGSSTPLTAAWAAARVARWHGVPWIFEVRDLWPDFPVQMGALSSQLARNRLYALERALYRSAAHVVPLSPDMETHIVRQGIPPERVTTLLNGTDLDLADRAAAPIDVPALEGRSIVLYAGTFGRANDMPTLVETARRLVHRRDLAFVCLGSGYYEPFLKQHAAVLPNLFVFSPIAHHLIFSWFRRAALSVVPFKNLPVLAANSPAKLFDSLAVGTPVLVTNPGWTKDLVERQGCGWYVPAENPAALAARIEVLLDDPAQLSAAGERGRALARRELGRDRLSDRFTTLVEHVAAKGAAGRAGLSVVQANGSTRTTSPAPVQQGERDPNVYSDPIEHPAR